MNMEAQLPATADLSNVIFVFVVVLVVFHVVFLWAIPLQQRGWKRADYAWLALTALTLFAASGAVRRTSATNWIGMQELQVSMRYDDVRNRVRFLSGPAVCITFVRSPLSPPDFDEIQHEYDAVCGFATPLYRELSQRPPQTLDTKRFEARPHIKNPMLLDFFKDLDHDLAEYQRAEQALRHTVEASAMSPLETHLTVMWPFVFAVALALRITKVSGELRTISHTTAKPRATVTGGSEASNGPEHEFC